MQKIGAPNDVKIDCTKYQGLVDEYLKSAEKFTKILLNKVSSYKIIPHKRQINFFNSDGKLVAKTKAFYLGLLIRNPDKHADTWHWGYALESSREGFGYTKENHPTWKATRLFPKDLKALTQDYIWVTDAEVWKNLRLVGILEDEQAQIQTIGEVYYTLYGIQKILNK